MEDLIHELEAQELTGYSRSSLLKKRTAGLLPYERDTRTGRVYYRLEDLRAICGGKLYTI